MTGMIDKNNQILKKYNGNQSVYGIKSIYCLKHRSIFKTVAVYFVWISPLEFKITDFLTQMAQAQNV